MKGEVNMEHIVISTKGKKCYYIDFTGVDKKRDLTFIDEIGPYKVLFTAWLALFLIIFLKDISRLRSISIKKVFA